ncbi:ubiquinone biosynthesis accessory factor UbiJ [Aliidiomarina sp.]|uniref:ubiquinone biosynthesis accessory factor UbiJ n=1 Tax=Aliidiomarina sp. TaxID=1872439 RepID=UPI003A4E4B5D
MQVLRASAERTINFALANDAGAEQRLAAVQGKSFRLTAKGLPDPITIVFLADRVSLMGPLYEAVDCEVTAALADLPELSDASNVTHMLQSGRVSIVGDPVLAQQAANVFTKLDVDWEELLASYLGDVPGYWASQAIQKLQGLKPSTQAWQTRASEFLTQEYNVAASPLSMALLSDDVKALERRLTRLEQRAQDFVSAPQNNDKKGLA